jgi:Protein of unknown function (DUF1826)
MIYSHFNAIAHIAAGSRPRVLGALRLPQYSGAVWQADLPARVTDYLDALDLEAIAGQRGFYQSNRPERRGSTWIIDTANDIRQETRHWLTPLLPQGQGRHQAIMEISRRIAAFTVAARAPLLYAQLQIKGVNPPPVLHLDPEKLRGFFTLRGGGSWLARDHVRAETGVNAYGLLADAVIAGEVVQMQRGHVLASKGRPVIHKSECPLFHAEGKVNDASTMRMTMMMIPMSK